MCVRRAYTLLLFYLYLYLYLYLYVTKLQQTVTTLRQRYGAVTLDALIAVVLSREGVDSP